MGTRNLTCVVHEGKYKVAQYCQWDGYPKGQGVIALKFLLTMDKNKFIEKLNRVRYAEDGEVKDLWNLVGADPKSNMVTMDVAEKFKKTFFHLSRDCGTAVLQIINDGDGDLPLVDSLSFAADSLFCEWAYVVDLDKNTFEVYKGFNTRKLGKKQRFVALNEQCKKAASGNQYYPVRMTKSFNLGELPTEQAFMDMFKE